MTDHRVWLDHETNDIWVQVFDKENQIVTQTLYSATDWPEGPLPLEVHSDPMAVSVETVGPPPNLRELDTWCLFCGFPTAQHYTENGSPEGGICRCYAAFGVPRVHESPEPDMSDSDTESEESDETVPVDYEREENQGQLLTPPPYGGPVDEVPGYAAILSAVANRPERPSSPVPWEYDPDPPRWYSDWDSP